MSRPSVFGYFFIGWLLCLSCGSSNDLNKPLLVATAASNQFALEAVAEAFATETGIETKLIVGASGKLTAQILAGAPYDVFISADARYPRKLQQAGKLAGPPRVFGRGSLMLWTTRKPASLSLDSLPPTARLAIANPALAPYGQLADSLLRLRPDYDSKLAPRLVYGESISQVNRFVLTGAATYGLTARSSLLAPRLRNRGSYLDFHPEARIPQTSCVLVGARESAAGQFQEFLLGPAGRRILATYGYD